MNYPYIEIKLEENISEETKIFIEKYWLIENGKFVNTPTELRNENCFSQHKVSKLLYFSSFSIITGKCIECERFIRIPVKSQTEAKDKIKNHYFHFLCLKCKSNLQNKTKSLSYIDAKKLQLQHSYKYRIWEKLKSEEIDILKAIIRLNSWNKVYEELVKPDFENVYEIIKKLNDIHLIDIYRNEITGKIREVYFLPELVELFGNNKTFVKESNSLPKSGTSRIAQTKHVSEVIDKKHNR